MKVNGVDVFDPNTGEVRSDGADGIACWFIDTDYNEESFFVRHAYFLGANDPYKRAQDHAEGRDRRGSLGDAQQRHLAPVRQAEVGPHRGEGDQPPRRRGDEGVPGGVMAQRHRVKLHVENLGPIRDASLTFADLTVLIRPPGVW